jgi:MFS family permease
VWVKELTGSDELAALCVLALCVLALCVLALWAPTPAGPALGTLADRVRRKPLLTAGMLLLAGLLLTLFVVDSRDTVWLLFAVLFVYGAVGVVHDAAESALVAAAVAPRLLGDFNGLRTTAVEGMKLVAPLAGAGVYAAYGGASVALLDGATFVLATRMYAALPVREAPPQRPAVNWRRRTAEGARYLWCPSRRPALGCRWC